MHLKDATMPLFTLRHLIMILTSYLKYQCKLVQLNKAMELQSHVRLCKLRLMLVITGLTERRGRLRLTPNWSLVKCFWTHMYIARETLMSHPFVAIKAKNSRARVSGHLVVHMVLANTCLQLSWTVSRALMNTSTTWASINRQLALPLENAMSD